MKAWIFNLIFRFKRACLWWWQRRTRGFDDREVWNLDRTIARFVLPRLKLLKARGIGYPGSMRSLKQWHACLDKMIGAFEHTASHDLFESSLATKTRPNHQKGLDLFAKYFWNLWE